MRYLPPNPDNFITDHALGPALITGAFSALFTLSLTVVFAPQFLNSLPGATLAGIMGLALVYSAYAWLVRDLRAPFLFHLLFFLLFQWLGLFRTSLEQGNFPVGLSHPFALIRTQPEWFVLMAGGGVVSFYFNHTLLALQRLPKALPSGRGAIENLLLSVSAWEQNWKSWRFEVFGAIIVTAVSYMVGYGWLGLKHSAFWAGVFLWLQLALGVWLILIGHFYYRRAVWKAVDLAPDPETKRVWGWGLAVWFATGVLISLALPVGFRFNQWRLFYPFLGLFRFFAGGSRAFEAPQMPGSLMEIVVTSPEGPNWVMALITLFYWGFLFLIAAGGLFLSLILIGSLINKFFAKEADRLRGLPKALLKLYLFFRGWWRRKHWNFRPRMEPGRVLKEAGVEEARLRVGYNFGRGPRAVIRRGYSRLINSARQNGYAWRQNQTPREIAMDLSSMFPESEEALTRIAGGYQEARYGPRPPSRGLARLFERLRREVQNRLRFMK
ncbi:MAG: DUF4129 domain-containing protein [Firmicutes bacterium]|nr:DUF4129 domain-containing protein [Bacillota bacterium]